MFLLLFGFLLTTEADEGGEEKDGGKGRRRRGDEKKARGGAFASACVRVFADAGGRAGSAEAEAGRQGRRATKQNLAD